MRYHADHRAVGHRFEDFLGVMLLSVGFAAVFLDEAAVMFRRKMSPEIANAFASITDIGKSDWILIPLGLAILFLFALNWRSFDRGLRASVSSFLIYAGYIFTAVAASGILVIIVKILIGRARPKFFDQLGAFDFSPLTFDAGYASFPSGHAATVFALVGAGLFLFPRLRVLLIAIGVWSALSRTFVGAHYPSDLAAGMLIGLAVSYRLARWMAARRLGFRFDADGSVEPLHLSWPLHALKRLRTTAQLRFASDAP